MFGIFFCKLLPLFKIEVWEMFIDVSIDDFAVARFAGTQAVAVKEHE
jgi:hypothetical protein